MEERLQQTEALKKMIIELPISKCSEELRSLCLWHIDFLQRLALELTDAQIQELHEGFMMWMVAEVAELKYPQNVISET